MESRTLTVSNNAPGWGLSRFISLEDFKDSSNGYLVKTKCCFEAEAATIGSSRVEHGLNRSGAKRAFHLPAFASICTRPELLDP
ncbi:hypothetical protein C2845_PM02G11580 [Panicum miliaceum]|uniref:MATH domain-containing protein n=1 Tax=Panicum miliaceum TaxID=4540 RepID=A0A3L6SFE2_PANMI|nr:hypothetical protein C2845_PM02G11580 [Panicum miliaceum]